jgi:hypothetical protein
MTANFKNDLKRGAAGEDRIAKLFPTWTRESGRKQDFTMPDGTKVEVKTESRTTAQTPNVALEFESSPGKPGAVRRAVDDGVTVIVYLFKDDKLFFYDARKLYDFMVDNVERYRMVSVPNSTYVTQVLIVPRAHLKEVEVDKRRLSHDENAPDVLNAEADTKKC